MTPSLGIEPGPHWWEASALTTAPSLHPLFEGTFIIAELRGVKRSSGAPWIRFFRKSIDMRNLGYDVSVRPSARTDCRGGIGEARQPLGRDGSGNFWL